MGDLKLVIMKEENDKKNIYIYMLCETGAGHCRICKKEIKEPGVWGNVSATNRNREDQWFGGQES